MLQAARDRQPLSPARLGGGTCRQEAEVPSSISAPPPSSCKREERQPGSREQQVLAKGQNRVRRLLSPVSAALCCSVRDQLGAGRRLLPTLFPRLRACNPPLPLSPRLSKHNPFRPRLEERAPPPSPPPHHGRSPAEGTGNAVCVYNPAPLHLPTGEPGAVPSAPDTPYSTLQQLMQPFWVP